MNKIMFVNLFKNERKTKKKQDLLPFKKLRIQRLQVRVLPGALFVRFRS